MTADPGLQELLERQRDKLGRFGLGKPIVSTVHGGQRIVVVGDALHRGSWKRFPDFLVAYLSSTFGVAWMTREKERRPSEQHPVLSWWSQLGVGEGTRVVRALAAGGTACFRLANDLYTVQHNAGLPDALLTRLRHREQFQGARHELWAAATCIRAGCSLKFEDESDRGTKHCEFVATHTETGQRFSVEAKARRQPGVKGASGPREEGVRKFRLGRLLNAAAEKPFDHPPVFFVDANLPDRPALDDPHIRKIANSIARTAGDSEPWNLLVVSSFPDEWDERRRDVRTRVPLVVFPGNPLAEVASVEAVAAIAQATLLFGAVPSSFFE